MILATVLLLAAQGAKPVAPKKVEPQSIALAKMRQTFATRKWVKGDIAYTSYGRPGKGTFAYLSTGFFKITDDSFTIVSNGLKGVELRHDSKTYSELDPGQIQDMGSSMPGFSAVLAWAKPTRSNGPERLEKLNGVDVVVVPIEAPGAPADYSGAVYLDAATSIPLMLKATRNGVGTEEYRFLNVVFDPPLNETETRPTPALTAADFSLAPPEGYTKGEPPAPTEIPTPVAEPKPIEPGQTVEVARPEPTPVETGPTGFRGVAGEWLNGFKVSTKIGTGKVLEKPYWTFVVYAKESAAYDWASAVSQARVKAGWRRAIYLGTTKDGGMILGCEKKEPAAPTALSINVRRKNAETVTRFGFEWKKKG
ncbi:hypothetical protein EON79_10025 [bacterium]|nr:MAG: hypothetical protein EON79_10025 [bacterium]